MKILLPTLLKKVVSVFILLLSTSLLLVAGDSTRIHSTGSWGVGFRFNNPSGITIKKNMGSKALELTVGRSNPWNYNAYRIFRRNKDFKGFHYSGYEAIYRPWNFQVHYLVHRNSGLFPGIRSYYGFGPQLNSYAFDYSYYYQNGANLIYENKTIHRTTLGADALAGLEYTFRRIPVTLFADLTAYMEIVGYPLHTRIRTGWGFRVNL